MKIKNILSGIVVAYIIDGENMKLKIHGDRKGFTLIELLVVIAIVGIIAVMVAPEFGVFSANTRVRECATELNQNMRLARAMAVKENRQYLMVFHMAGNPSAAINPQGRYLIGVDIDGDNDLTTVSTSNNGDTFGPCKDTKVFDVNEDGDLDDAIDRGDGIPDNDDDVHPKDGDGVPDCVKVFNLNECGTKIVFGTLAPNGPDGTSDTICANGLGVCFGNTSNPVRVGFDPDGSATDMGSVYLEHNNASNEGKRYSYVFRISSNAGAMSMWRWNGDKDYTIEQNWTQLR